ncbi:MAG: hypothetical protein ABWX88_01705 [Pseudoxanthomonas sp.]
MINDSFSLMRGGLVYRLLTAMGALHPGMNTAPFVAGLMFVVSFVPLLVLSAADGSLLSHGRSIPLLGDYAALSRFLIVVPLLILAAPYSDALLRGAIRQVAHSGLVRPSRQDALDSALARVRKLRDSNIPELLCFVLALLPLLRPQSSLSFLGGAPDWRTAPDGLLTDAGRWFELVSVPIFRFVAFIWAWRFLLWSYLLWRLARLRLDLHPAHPDGAGGIGFLGVAQQRFAVLPLAGGILLCGACINHIKYLGETVAGMKHLLIGYVVGSTVLLLLPLLLLSPLMMKAKRHALLKYNALGNRAIRLFDRRWRRGEADQDGDSLLDKGDASALADFTGVYEKLSAMSMAPMTRWTVVWVALHAALPLLPLLLFAMSIDELARKLMSILI